MNLRKAARAVTQLYDRHLRPSGLKGTQFSILAVLANTGAIPLSRLAEVLVMDRTTLSRNLEPLERDGLVSVTEGKDRRVRQVALKPRGRKALAGALPLWEAAQGQVVKEIGGAGRWGEILKDLMVLQSVRAAGP
jgi:DNA-binding MarR family transcriptional regulator